MKVEKLIEEVDSLPLEIKTQLIERLLESINPSQKDIDAAWASAAEIRLKDIKDGSVKTIPGEHVFEEIQNKYSK